MSDVVPGSIAFDTRLACELCGDDRKTVLLSKSLTDSLICDFLQSYYQGRIPEGVLLGGKYELAKCNGCGFIWQTQILNDSGMHKLYTEWISGESSLKKKLFAD